MNSYTIDRGIEWGLMVVAATILVADLNHLLEYGFIALAIVVLTRQIASRDRRLARTSLDVPILVFLGWILISIVTATDPNYSFAEWRKLLAHVLMFFLVVNFISEEGQVKRILGAFVVGMCLMSLYGIAEFFLAEGAIAEQWRERTIRADSLTSEYHWFSTYLMMGLPIVAVWALSADHRQWRGVLVVTLVVATFALFLTYTRGAWIAVAVQACLLVALKGPKVMKLVVAGLLVVALCTLLVVIMQGVPKNAPGERGVEGHTTLPQTHHRPTTSNKITSINRDKVIHIRMIMQDGFSALIDHHRHVSVRQILLNRLQTWRNKQNIPQVPQFDDEDILNGQGIDHVLPETRWCIPQGYCARFVPRKTLLLETSLSA